MKKPECVYLSGPMSGIPHHNILAFDDAAEDLRDRGINVYSPAEMDSPEVREAALDSDGSPVGKWEDFLARDIRVVCQPDVESVVVLPGWEGSKGARFEVDVARRLGKPILAYPNLNPTTGIPTVTDALKSVYETRITDPDTGGQKGQKLERYDLIPFAALDELARVYGMGAQKYDDDNYLNGYRYRLSLGALLRHVAAWGKGEDRDPESGLHHLAHAAWHCFALQMFQRHDLGTDDRWTP